MRDILVLHPHAYIHNLTDHEIEYAWYHYIIEHEREEDENGEIEIVRIGPESEYVDIDHVAVTGNYTHYLGIIGTRKPYGYLIERAKRPPINSLLEEINAAKGSM